MVKKLLALLLFLGFIARSLLGHFYKGLVTLTTVRLSSFILVLLKSTSTTAMNNHPNLHK